MLISILKTTATYWRATKAPLLLCFRCQKLYYENLQKNPNFKLPTTLSRFDVTVVTFYSATNQATAQQQTKTLITGW